MEPMTQKKHTPTCTAEFRARGIRLFKENRANHVSDNTAASLALYKVHNTLMTGRFNSGNYLKQND